MYRDIIGNIDKAWLLKNLFVKRTMGNRIHSKQFSMLKFIYEHPDCTQADIANFFHVSPASVAVSTKRLQKSELITKTVEEKNLRCKRIRLTERGNEEFLKYKKIFNDYECNVIFANFSDKELISLKSCLEKLNRNMEKAEGIYSSDNTDEVIAQIMERLCRDSEDSDK